MKDLLVIHIGAGNHAVTSNKKYSNLLRKALSHNNILDAASEVEVSNLTNTGYGSSLNKVGKVEIDASFIDSASSFHASWANNCRLPQNGTKPTQPETKAVRIGSITGLKCREPTREMVRIFGELEQQYAETPYLTMPISLNCTSLKSYMKINEDKDEDLISAKAQRIYEIYNTDGISTTAKEEISDTVGLTQIKEHGFVMVTSSGGNFFKLPGRIGCAGVINAAISHKETNGLKISCMCSGNGEQIIRYNLASFLVEKFSTRFGELEWGSNLSKELFALDSELYIGFIVIIEPIVNIVNNNGGCEHVKKISLIYGHSTESFHFGYRAGDNETKTILSFAEKKELFTFGEYCILC
ncbi:hypothetical protein LELG_04405 [Lodderomyces elongisporus NRRL YB-4239]|uniref:Asparaginase n=1 Tax=Lodderomyces elongisporus (strain ATCC 11503 / CBS 2605 / JCM 1781 / NBRC 1676 / NRRL YB-4239) TaxID=379508 RepID=A5E466_LODEL|nr:hypothetical protein LELG_04405 [Lodderomyces elongisporus NRRL YB-4239]